MKKLFAIVGAAFSIAFASLPACAQTPPPASSQVVARINGAAITMDRLQAPLVEGYGLNMLITLVQLDLAKQNAEKAHLRVTPQDIAAEREQTIEHMFQASNVKLQEKLDEAVEQKRTADADRIRAEMKDDNERGFHQFLENQHKSEVEFNLVIETNAYLRKSAEPILAGKITDESLREAFAALYGETVECRHIQCANIQEIQEAKRRLAAGVPFEKVARDMSRNEETRMDGGRLRAFSRQIPTVPQAFKDAAFALKPGEVSDIVQAEGAFHLILLEKRNPPKVVKFEDVKESLRRDLHDRAVEAIVKQLRQQIGEQLLQNIAIEDPVLKQQFESRIRKRQGEITSQEEIRKQMERQSINSATQPAPPPRP